MRLFIAVELPQEVKQELINLQSVLKKDFPSLKYVNVNNMHLTLKFLGDVPDGRLDEVKAKLSDVRVEKFEAYLSGCGVFPKPEYIKVVWAGLEPKEKINELQHKVDLGMRAIGFPKDRKFHPHATLARVRFVKDKAGLAKAIEQLKPTKISFDVDSFALIKSELRPDGPVYTVLEEYQ